MAVFFIALAVYAVGILLTAVGSRLAGRCATWCCALCGFPLWVVGGTVAAICLALPQLMLTFLAAGWSITGLAVGVALAGAVTDLGLVLALCLLSRHSITVDRGEFCSKCFLLFAACAVILLFVRDGTLSYTGTGLLMLLFVVFIFQNILYQHRFLYNEDLHLMQTGVANGTRTPPAQPSGYTAHTMAFPIMSVANALKNLAGVVGGIMLLTMGAQALVYSATSLANLTGTIQALWAATLISFGFCLPLLAEVLRHPFGTLWQKFSERCRFYPAGALPVQMLNSAILNLTLALPLSGLMYRKRLPVGAQFRAYELPACIVLSLVLLLPPLLLRKLSRKQGAACLCVYLVYLAAVLLAPLAGA